MRNHTKIGTVRVSEQGLVSCWTGRIEFRIRIHTARARQERWALVNRGRRYAARFPIP